MALRLTLAVTFRCFPHRDNGLEVRDFRFLNVK